uniref:Gamma-aminobutyric acid receptor subunit beta n=1 Tax=Romanomermis culicivorax TaxID=13658 RepID=A0A915JFP4_ROMCU
MYLRQTWVDPRLTWRNVPIDEITISVDYMKHIWVPDTFFPNEKKSFFHMATTHNSFLRITNKGRITTSQRLTVTASCGMDLHYFPLDTQTCSLEIESYGYSAEDIVLHWAIIPGKEPVVVDNQTELPTFALKQPLKYDRTIESLTTGDYSRLSCKFEFQRTLGFYWIQIYQPSILIVVISWVTFWINRDSAPARVTLGIMTVLTMTTLMSTTNRQMPKVSYVKAVDIYLVVCYVMVFAALLEYAVVSYSNKKKQDINKKKQVVVKSTRPETPVTQMTSGHSTLTHRKPMGNSVTTSSPSDGISLLNLTSHNSNPLSIPEDPRTTSGDAPLIDESEFTRLNFMISRK